MVLRPTGSLMPSADESDPITAADVDGRANSVRGTRDKGRSLMRPIEETKTALGTAASVVRTIAADGAAGTSWP
jgi:hypothetical protein